MMIESWDTEQKDLDVRLEKNRFYKRANSDVGGIYNKTTIFNAAILYALTEIADHFAAYDIKVD